MKIIVKYLIIFSILLINITCKKNIVEPSPPDLPSIINNSPIILTTTTVVLSGKIDLRGNNSVSIYFEYGLTNSYGSRTPEQKIISSGVFSAKIIDLTNDTTYHWRICCKATNGNITTGDSTFTILFLITNLAATNLTITNVTLNGQVDLHGRPSAIIYFEYGLTSSYGSMSPEQTITSSGTINTTLDNLTPGTTYHWRIHCKTSYGEITYSNDITFTTPTLAILPLLTNLPPDNLTPSSITLLGNIDLRGRNWVQIYFEYGLTTSYGSKTPIQGFPPIGYNQTPFSATLNYLKNGTTYHWRIYCITSDGDTYSSDTIFTTPSGVEFQYPLNIGQTWTYNYSLYIGYDPGPGSYKQQQGIHIWQVISKNVAGDSTIYNLICTTHDTISSPPSIEEKSIPFTIVVTSVAINVNFGQTLQYPTGPRSTPILPLPRFVSEGNTQVQLGNSLYVNGLGLYAYDNGFFSQSGGYYEHMNILE